MIVAKSVYDISSIEKGPLDLRFEEQIREMLHTRSFASKIGNISTNTLKVAINCGYVIVRNWNGEIGGEDSLKKKNCIERGRKEGKILFYAEQQKSNPDPMRRRQKGRLSRNGPSTAKRGRGGREERRQTREHPVIISGTQEPRAGPLDPVFNGHMFHPRPPT